MGRGWAATLLVVALSVSACGDDEGDGGSEDSGSSAESGVKADAADLVSCLEDAGIEASVKDSVAFGVESAHAGVEVSDLPSELLKYDSGSGTLSGVTLWVFESAEDASEARTPISLKTEDDESGWVDGRVVVSWYYPVNREAEQAVAVDDCVAGLND